MRVPSRIRWWCTPATASSAGIGAWSRVDAAVGQDDDTRARRRSPRCACGTARPAPAPGRSRPRLTGNRIGSVIALKPCGALAVELPQLVQLLVGQDGRVQLDLPGRPRRRVEQVALAADGGLHRHDDLFADAVHRRVGDLGEELLEVVVEQLRPIREHGQGGVVAHRADRLVAVGRHRRQQDPQVLAGVAERLLPQQHGLVVGLVRRPAPAGRSSSVTMLSRSHSA